MQRTSGDSTQVRHSRSSLEVELSAQASQTVGFRPAKQPDIFARLTATQRNRVVARGVYLHLSEGETLFAQGERHRGIYLVEHGLVRTFYTSPAGREITLAYWQSGNIVGTPQIFGTDVNQWSGIATTKTGALFFRSEDLLQLIERNPAFAVGLVEALEFKGKCLSALVQMLGTRSVAERLAMLLHNLAELHGIKEKDGIALGQPFTHEVLAQMVGASRQWVTMTLDRMRNEGLIRTGKGRTVILQPQKMTDIRSSAVQNFPPAGARRKTRKPSFNRVRMTQAVGRKR
jgi:CRP/FNR family transcriptional regulator, cyclic AMP receptor protein